MSFILRATGSGTLRKFHLCAAHFWIRWFFLLKGHVTPPQDNHHRTLLAGVGFLVFSGVFVFFLVFLCFFWCFLVFSGVFWFFLVFLCFWWWWWCVIDCSKKPGKVFGGGCLVVAERALYLRQYGIVLASFCYYLWEIKRRHSALWVWPNPLANDWFKCHFVKT